MSGDRKFLVAEVRVSGNVLECNMSYVFFGVFKFKNKKLTSRFPQKFHPHPHRLIREAMASAAAAASSIASDGEEFEKERVYRITASAWNSEGDAALIRNVLKHGYDLKGFAVTQTRGTVASGPSGAVSPRGKQSKGAHGKHEDRVFIFVKQE